MAAAIVVVALIGQRRQEARQQVAVRGMQFEDVEADLAGALVALHEVGGDAVHVVARIIERAAPCECGR
jgi:hypothetical protein